MPNTCSNFPYGAELNLVPEATLQQAQLRQGSPEYWSFIDDQFKLFYYCQIQAKGGTLTNQLLKCIVYVSASQQKRYGYCLKSVQIRSFFWSVFSRIRTEYGDLLRKHFSHVSLTGIRRYYEIKYRTIWFLDI